MEYLDNCPVCGDELNPHKKIKDHFLTGEEFPVDKCNNCNVLVTNPRPDTKEIEKYYNSPDYISHNKNKTSFLSLVYKLARAFTLKSKTNLINKYATYKGNLLDYGCGTGDFLNEANKNGWKPLGFEPNLKAAQQARSFSHNKIFEQKDDLSNLNGINAITLWHVLEHVHELKNTIQLFNKIISKEGHLFIAVPNPYSYDASIYKEAWAAYDVPRHLYHFSKNSIKHLLESNNFQLKEIKPLKLDAFYISLLSEKYKTGKTNYIKAFFNGLISNIKAKKSTNYSSLLYIAKSNK